MKSLIKYTLPALAVALILPVATVLSSSGVSGRGETEVEIEHGVEVVKPAAHMDDGHNNGLDNEDEDKVRFEIKNEDRRGHDDDDAVEDADENNSGPGSGVLREVDDEDLDIEEADENKELEITAENEGLFTQIKIKAKAEMAALTKQEVMQKIKAMLTLNKAAIDAQLEMKALDLENDLENRTETKAEVKDGMGKGEVEIRFPVDSFDRQTIVDAIFEKLASFMPEA